MGRKNLTCDGDSSSLELDKYMIPYPGVNKFQRNKSMSEDGTGKYWRFEDM